MTKISAKIENNDRSLFEGILNSIGLNVTTSITAFVKATTRKNGIPFDLKATDDPYVYSEENMKFLHKSIDQIENGNGKVHELKENP